MNIYHLLRLSNSTLEAIAFAVLSLPPTAPVNTTASVFAHAATYDMSTGRRGMIRQVAPMVDISADCSAST